VSPVPGVSATTQSQVLCAAWRRTPGALLSGSVAITDEAGNRRKFEIPEAFVPRACSGSWIFIANATPSA